MMEQFPKKQETKKRSGLGKAVMGGLSAAALGGMTKVGMNPEMAPTYEAQSEPSKAEQPASEADLTHTDIPQGFTLEPEQPPKEVVEIIAQKLGPGTLRPELRPEEWKSLSDFEYPLMMLDHIVKQEAQRLGINPDKLQKRLDNWFNMLADIESDWNYDAANPKSSGRGIYQYLTANHDKGKQNGSIHTAINRMYDVLLRSHVVDAQPGHPAISWADDLYLQPETISDIPIDAQQILVFSDLVQSNGSDRLLRQLVDSDPVVRRQAAIDLYYDIHHTNPDEKTIANLERDIDDYFPLPEISDVVLAQN